MNAMELRPLSTGEILDRTFTLYRRNFLLFLGISAIPHIIVLALNLMQSYLLSPATTRSLHASVGVSGQAPTFPSGSIIAGFGMGFLILAVTWFVYLLTQGATVTAVSEIYLGHSITIGQAFRRIRGEMGSLFGVSLLNGLATGVGFLLLIIPGIYLMCRLMLCIPAAVIENLGPRDSLERSFSLTKDNAGRAFLILLLYFVLVFGAAALITWPLMFAMVTAKNNPAMMLFWTEMTQVGTAITTVLIVPVLTIASSIFYFDLRIRKEALDIQMMMTPAGGRVPVASPVPTMFS
jgi:hypothetical protein